MAVPLAIGDGAAPCVGLGRVAELAALSGLSGSDQHGASSLVEAARRAGPVRTEAARVKSLSDLTSIGAPFEAAFLWPAGDMRISLDPCPGALPAARRAACLARLGVQLAPEQQGIFGLVCGWQQAHAGRYGAWLGIRLREAAGAGRCVTRKLYLDVPEGAPWQAWEGELIDAPAVLPRREPRLTMIGLDPVKGGAELYWRCGRLYPGELDTLLRRFRLPERGSEIVDWITALTRRSVRFELPAYDMGFSCAFDAAFQPRVFTWYANAVSLLGPPERIREALLRVGRKAGWPMADYAALTAPDRAGRVPVHGLLGAILAADAPFAVTATVAVGEAAGQAGDMGGKREFSDV